MDLYFGNLMLPTLKMSPRLANSARLSHGERWKRGRGLVRKGLAPVNPGILA